MKYRLILFGKEIYREIALPENPEKEITVGTSKECMVRFNRERLFADFQIALEKRGEQWYLLCRENVYLMENAVLRQSVRELSHGDNLSLYYSDSDICFLKLEILFDFEEGKENFTSYVDLAGLDSVSIGGQGSCDLFIQDSILLGERLILKRGREGWLAAAQSVYGLYVNGCRRMEREARLKDRDFFSMGGKNFYLKENRLYFSGKENLRTSLRVLSDSLGEGVFQYPHFRRSAREQYRLPEEEIKLKLPKQAPGQPKKNLLATLAPLLVSLLLLILLRGMMGGGGIFIVYSACMMAMGGATSVWNYRKSGKEYREALQKREETYIAYLSAQEEKIKSLRQQEWQTLRRQCLTARESVELAVRFSPRLFERRPLDPDYLTVCLGLGKRKTACKVTFSEPDYKDTEDPLSEYPARLAEKYAFLDEAPITLDFREVGGAGFCGPRDRLYEMVKNISLDLAARQFYTDVRLYYILDEEDIGRFAWLRWLRNVWDPRTGNRNLFYDEESRKKGLEALFTELSRREDGKKGSGFVRLAVFVYRTKEFLIHPVSRFLPKAKELGVTFLFFEERADLLPLGCSTVVSLDGRENTGTVRACEDAGKTECFRYPLIEEESAGEAARILGCISTEEVSLEKSLTSKISFYELLGILHAKDLNLEKRWGDSRIYQSMAAPLGVAGGNEILYLDLHEKAAGPHGLVAGTTGSGKSEILQTYILSMATLFHPYEVGFVIIDFKGGGMVNQFRKLPHLNGAITNIDGREINRSLMSIQAELKKRQRLFAESGVNHINAYIKAYRAGTVREPLPHLILIVDEFAELKNDQPEFMKELISAARIGRSLGVHLILATQKPSGVVDGQIWSNSRFKLCLKVQNREDSNEVLKSPLAAEIKEPGRAYLQVGNNEVFRLFQSAYSGSPILSDSMGRQRSYRIFSIDPAGRQKMVFEKSLKKTEQDKTQLEAVVEYIADYCEGKKISSLPDICLPSLPDILEEMEREQAPAAAGVWIPVGKYDDPANQYQGAACVNFSGEHVFLLGASRYGKTNFVQNAIRELAKAYTPKEVSLYILDFATMVLKPFEKLCHVGGVVTAYEEEKLKNFMKMIGEEMNRRKAVLSKLGLGSYYAYLEGGYKELPQIVVILENLTGFRELYPQHEETLLRLCREGVSCGISLLVTNSQTGGVSYRYLTNFGKKIALHCNNSSEYYTLFDHCRTEPKDTPGRALLEIDRNLYECQTCLAFPGEREVDRVKKMEAFIEETNGRCGSVRARRIPEIPPVLTEALLACLLQSRDALPYTVPLGLNYETTEAEWLELNNMGLLGICARENMGRGNFLRYLLTTLDRRAGKEPMECRFADQVSRPFAKLEELGILEEYTVAPERACEWIREADIRLEARYQLLAEGREELLEKEPFLLLVFHSRDCVQAVSQDKKTMEAYKRLIGKYRMLKVCVLLSDLENASAGFGAPEAVKPLKESRNYLIFEDLGQQKLCDVPLAAAKEFKKPIEPGDAYRICGNRIVKVKTVLCGQDTA